MFRKILGPLKCYTDRNFFGDGGGGGGGVAEINLFHKKTLVFSDSFRFLPEPPNPNMHLDEHYGIISHCLKPVFH
jgi:hypothetical protein